MLKKLTIKTKNITKRHKEKHVLAIQIYERHEDISHNGLRKMDVQL